MPVKMKSDEATKLSRNKLPKFIIVPNRRSDPNELVCRRFAQKRNEPIRRF